MFKYILMAVLSVVAQPAVAGFDDDTCNVADVHSTVVGACYAYQNPPEKVKELIMDTSDSCYQHGKGLYDDIVAMSAGQSEAAYAVHHAAAEEALRQTYYNCKKKLPILGNADAFLSQYSVQ